MCLQEVPAGVGETDKTMHGGRVVRRERSVGPTRDAVVVGQAAAGVLLSSWG